MFCFYDLHCHNKILYSDIVNWSRETIWCCFLFNHMQCKNLHQCRTSYVQMSVFYYFRRVLFTFTFFMFFYNIFMGIVSCLLRIIKSMIIGTMFLCRLDNSALPRRFQMFDPGKKCFTSALWQPCTCLRRQISGFFAAASRCCEQHSSLPDEKTRSQGCRNVKN